MPWTLAQVGSYRVRLPNDIKAWSYEEYEEYGGGTYNTSASNPTEALRNATYRWMKEKRLKGPIGFYIDQLRSSADVQYISQPETTGPSEEQLVQNLMEWAQDKYFVDEGYEFNFKEIEEEGRRLGVPQPSIQKIIETLGTLKKPPEQLDL